MTTSKACVLYCRVSSREQGSSGLSLDHQEAALRGFAEALGLPVRAVHREVASAGGRTLLKRPELRAAVARARRERLALLVLRPDRLGRDLALASRLVDLLDVKFSDSPNASKLEVALRLAVAAEERRLTALRTREALAVLKARGIKLGSRRSGHWEGRERRRLAGSRTGAQARALSASSLRGDLPQRVAAFALEAGEESVYRLADLLNEQQDLTPLRGGRWHPTTVRRLLQQASERGGIVPVDWIELPVA